jgi:hypothetical protein
MRKKIKFGFYWIKCNKKWTIAEKTKDGWYLTGSEVSLEETGDTPEIVGEEIIRQINKQGK